MLDSTPARSPASTIIRAMTAEDVGPASELLRRGAFGDRDEFLRWAVGQPTVTPFVAEAGEQIAGTGVASAHGAVGWVGVIFVAEAFRGRGLGRQLTRRVIERLEDQGCRSFVLIASPLGRPIYEREGFTVLDRQVRFTIDSVGTAEDEASSDDRLRPFEAADLDAVLELDRFATGEDRSAVLTDLLAPATTTVAFDAQGPIRGYLARPPWRGGAIIAPDPEDALRLLERRRRMPGQSGRTGAGVLGSNTRGRELLRAAGWDEEAGNVRMLRGEPLEWHPEAIWAQMNGALG